jgi:hypothetical protein
MKLPLFLLALAMLASPAQALEVHVSPGGPMASLAGARDAVRLARAAGDRSAARVVVAEGTYTLTEPVVFEPRDSGVTYEAAPGAKPVFTGGRRIGGWKAGLDGVWTAQVEPGKMFEALWVNGRRATRARTPNEGYIQALGQPTTPLPGVALRGKPAATMIQIAPVDAAPIAAVAPAEQSDVQVVVLHSWNETRHRVAGVRVADGTLQFTGGSREFFTLEPYHRLWLEGLRSALDQPGEWLATRDGTVHYRPLPGEKLENIDAWAPVAERWIVITGDPAKDETLVRDLHFRGLTFEHQHYPLPPGGVGFVQAEAGLGAAIEADGAHGVTFERCTFRHTMTNALWLRRGCRDIAVRECLLTDLGAGGVKIAETTVRKDREHTSHVTVENCIIHSGGRYFPSAIGVLIFHGSDCVVRHCDIGDFFYSAISIGWTWGYKPTPCARNLVENCRLHHLGWAVLSDMGAVYTLGPQPGTVIRGCHIHHIGSASYGGWGMYNDEGSTGIVWENNLVHDTQGAGYHQHYGRGNIVRNNIIARGLEEHVRWSKPEEFFAFAFERNIVLVGDGRLFMHVDKNWDTGRVFLAANTYWKPGGEIAEFAGKSWADWQFLGRDNTSVVADPLFVDVARGDWTLRPESPALKLGFVPFDWRKAGVHKRSADAEGDAAWRTLAAREFPPMIYGRKPQAQPLTMHDGFEDTPVGAKPARARIHKQRPGMIVVTRDRPSRGARCIELTDGPDITPHWEPHLFYVTNVESGTVCVAFDVRMERGYQLVHEWRDDAQPYRTGPMLTFDQGAISAPGRKLADLPDNAWVHVEIVAKIGAGSDAPWDCTLTLPGQPAQRFAGLKFVNPEMKALKWIGWASNGKAAAKCWLDEIEVGPRK